MNQLCFNPGKKKVGEGVSFFLFRKGAAKCAFEKETEETVPF